jgi:hypothetical protein
MPVDRVLPVGSAAGPPDGASSHPLVDRRLHGGRCGRAPRRWAWVLGRLSTAPSPALVLFVLFVLFGPTEPQKYWLLELAHSWLALCYLEVGQGSNSTG